MAKKQIKQFVTFDEVRLAIETNKTGRVFAVNLEQYRDLTQLEGQAVIQEVGYTFIEKVAEKLKKCPRIRKNYIITSPNNGTI